MTLVGGDFIGDLAGVASIVLAACGLFLVFLDVNRPNELGAARQYLSTVAARLMTIPLRRLGRETLGASSRVLQRFIYVWFEQSESNVVVTGVFTAIVLVTIPLAALINWARGGSPLALIVVIGCLVAFLLLAVLGEMRRAPGLTAFLSPLLFATLFVFLPGYVFVSLTDRMRQMPVGHAALTSLLVAPILYVACQSVVLGVAGTWGALVPSVRGTALRRIATAFAAALPFAYLLLFAAVVFGHLAMSDMPRPTEWLVLVSAVIAPAAAMALTVYFIGEPRTSTRGAILKSALVGIALCYLVGWISGYEARYDTLVLSPLFWLVHLALLPVLAVIGVLLLSALARGGLALLAGIAGKEAAAARPYLVIGAVLLVVAAGSGWAAALL